MLLYVTNVVNGVIKWNMKGLVKGMLKPNGKNDLILNFNMLKCGWIVKSVVN